MISSSASWIGMKDELRARSAPLFRKEFQLEAEPRKAKLSVCGLGFCESYINGRRVGDALLDPPQTDYEVRCLFTTHDVLKLLRRGANALGVMVGDGWYNQRLVWNKEMAYGFPRLIATLEIELADGSKIEISTGKSWRCAKGPITESNVYAGEHYDARMERPGWNDSGFSDEKLLHWLKWAPCETVAAPGGRLEECAMPPCKAIEELRPVSISEPQAGCQVVDFGQNFAGWARIEVKALAGTCVRLRFAEALAPDGMLDTASTGTFATGAEQVDSYICKGGGEAEAWEPRFAYHGFRYVEVSGWPGKLSPGAITGIAVHNALKPAGSFECSDKRLNKLLKMALWTHRSNMHGFPEDCPARERCGWLGDAHIICDYSLWSFDGAAFWEKYLDDIESARQLNGGLPTFIAPGKRRCGTASVDWMAALVIIPWTHYVHYGRPEIFARHWEGMKTVVERFKSVSEDWIVKDGLGDWFDAGGKQAQPVYTGAEKTSTLLFGQCAEIMAKAALSLGKRDDAARYAKWSESVRAAFQAKFYDKTARSFGSQTANAMALMLGFAPAGEEQSVADSIAKDALARDTHFTVGIMGMKYLFEALTRYGRGELALALLRQDSYPGFGDLIKKGATTLWEYWGEKEADEKHGARSLNHPMFGGYVSWLYNTLAGIRPDPENPGFKRFFLEPHPIKGLAWAKCSHESPQGRISSEWRVENGEFAWEVEIPEGSEATAKLPGSTELLKLPPGRKSLRVEMLA